MYSQTKHYTNNTNIMKKYILILSICLIAIVNETGAQTDNQQKQLHYWNDIDGYIKEQSRQSFLLIDQILNENPPTTNLSLIRKSALFNMDAILHDPRLDNNEVLYEFLDIRIKKINEALKKPVGEGLMIYKLYNDAFIIRTKSVTVAFDLFRGGRANEKPLISDALINEIVNQCDIMFVTHAHGDHADKVVADMFTKTGKKIIVPTGLWEGVSPNIRQLRSDQILDEKIELGKNKVLQVKIIPGHQGALANNIYVVTTPEGFTVAHTGDHDTKADFDMIAKIKGRPSVDVLFTTCWFIPLEELVNLFDPQLLITGHENELNHSIDHRESYWLNDVRAAKVNQKKVFMTWGEAFRYSK